MAENDIEVLEKMDTKKVALSAILKFGSGTLLLTIIGYAASWAFVTLNTLQEGVAQNTKTLEMIKEDVDRDRENMAQWKRIAQNDRNITDNEVEIKVLKEMLQFYIKHAERHQEEKPVIIGPSKPHKLDKLFDEFLKKDKKKPVDPEKYRNNTIQQMQQMPQIQQKTGP